MYNNLNEVQFLEVGMGIYESNEVNHLEVKPVKKKVFVTRPTKAKSRAPNPQSTTKIKQWIVKVDDQAYGCFMGKSLPLLTNGRHSKHLFPP